jgi:hypothetical protein
MRGYQNRDGADVLFVSAFTVTWRGGETKTYTNMDPRSGIEDGVLYLYSDDPAQPDVFIPGLGSGDVLEITETKTAVPAGGDSGPLPRIPARQSRLPVRPAGSARDHGDGIPQAQWRPAIVK